MEECDALEAEQLFVQTRSQPPDGSAAAGHMPRGDGHTNGDVVELGSSDDSDSGLVTLTRMDGVVVCGDPPIPAYLDGTLRDDFLEVFSPGRISSLRDSAGLARGSLRHHPVRRRRSRSQTVARVRVALP